ncbi:hypothetical protein GWK47_041244 [Chionoecetes opilio]|uniref:Uncharacterized protein n=1 Tax=Chionoecetes opilio TaxID=41210 RepID=A0A8J4YA40_CHIOP|nr:hypothetical protein GWK47_041244 [Chionoecetes opilio]
MSAKVLGWCFCENSYRRQFHKGEVVKGAPPGLADDQFGGVWRCQTRFLGQNRNMPLKGVRSGRRVVVPLLRICQKKLTMSLELLEEPLESQAAVQGPSVEDPVKGLQPLYHGLLFLG